MNDKNTSNFFLPWDCIKTAHNWQIGDRIGLSVVNFTEGEEEVTKFVVKCVNAHDDLVEVLTIIKNGKLPKDVAAKIAGKVLAKHGIS